MEAYIIAHVHMKPEADGGRHSEVVVGHAPHLVAPPSSTFLGVRVVAIEGADGYGVAYPGTEARMLFDLIYHPDVDYSALVKGADFDIHEGSNVVGTGRVLERY